MRKSRCDARRVTSAPHDWSIPEREYARQESRRGRRHAYEALDPASTALVVIDMVPFFADTGPYFHGIVPNVNALASAARAAGASVAWVLPAVAPATDWAVAFFGDAVASAFAGSGGTGPLPERLWPGLDAQPGDVWAEKTASSAFFPGRSTLPSALAARGVDTVLVAGTVTSVCCESSARDAATLGHRVIFVADATADVVDSAHNASLRTVHRTFGDVRSTGDVIAMLAPCETMGG